MVGLSWVGVLAVGDLPMSAKLCDSSCASYLRVRFSKTNRSVEILQRFLTYPDRWHTHFYIAAIK